MVWELENKNYIQDIKEDTHKAGNFWLYLEGDSTSTQSAGVYHSTDYGKTWQPTKSNPLRDYSCVPANEFKVERDLYPIVNYQHKRMWNRTTTQLRREKTRSCLSWRMDYRNLSI